MKKLLLTALLALGFISFSATAFAAIPLIGGDVTIVHKNGQKTVYAATTTTDYSRGQAFITAVNSAQNGDSIYLSNNRFDIVNTVVRLNTGLFSGNIVNLYGTGSSTIVISGTGSLVTAYGSVVSGIKVYGNAGNFPVQIDGDPSATTVTTFQNMDISGAANDSTGIVDGYFFTSTPSGATINFINDTVESRDDTLLVSGSATFNVYGGTYTSNNTSNFLPHGISCIATAANVFDATFIVNGTGNNSGIQAGSSCVVKVYGGSITTSGPSANYDLNNINDPSSSLYVDSAVFYSPTKTNNTILYLDNPQLRYSLGSSGTNGQVFQTDGTKATWVSTSTLGISQWTTSGSNIYYTNGNVGIGSTTPTSKLGITGVDTSANNYGLSVADSNNVNILTVKNNGAVTIDGHGSNFFLSNNSISNNNTPTLFFQSFNENSAYFALRDSASVSCGTSGSNNGLIDFQVVDTNNTIARYQPLGIYVGGTSFPSNRPIFGPTVSGQCLSEGIGATAGGTNGLLTLWTNNLERMRIGANIGIGTTTPWRTLSVNGNSDLGINALAGTFTATTSGNSSFAGSVSITGKTTVGAPQGFNGTIGLQAASGGDGTLGTSANIGGGFQASGNGGILNAAVYADGVTGASTNAYGFYSTSRVNNTSDAGSATGIYGASTQTHAGGPNYGVYSDASGGSSNYSFYGNTGTFFNSASAGIGIAIPATTLDVNGDITDENQKNCSSLATNSTGKISCQSAVATSTGSYRNQSATVSSVNTYTPTASSTYSVVVSTSVRTISAGTLTITCTYTNTDGVATTATFFPMGLTSAGLTSTGSASFSPLSITPMKNNPVTVVATFTGVSINYDIDASILPVGTATL